MLAHEMPEDGLLRVQAVLGLIEDDGSFALEGLVADFLTTMCGQVVHEDGARGGGAEQVASDLETAECLASGQRLLLLAHRGPDIGVNDVSALDGRLRIIYQDYDAAARAPRPSTSDLLSRTVQRIGTWRSDPDMQRFPCSGETQGPSDIGAIADVGQGATARTAVLANGEEVGEGLARVLPV